VTAQVQEDYAEKLLGPWREIGQGMGLEPQTVYLHEEDVGAGVIRLALQNGCDLIVMGTRGREGLSRVFLGSVAERVSRLAPVPVLLVRGDGPASSPGGLFRRILAPTDGSEASLPAVTVADRLASALGAELRFLFVIPSMLPLSDPFGTGGLAMVNYDEILASLEAQGKAALEAAKAGAKTPKVSTELLRSEYRREADAIVGYAKEGGFDLVVMGTHGRTGLDRLLLGSVAEGVTHHATVPLLLVRPSQVTPAPKPEAAQAASG
jgi:nucleotide-binding universal stress UspA family protein